MDELRGEAPEPRIPPAEIHRQDTVHGDAPLAAGHGVDPESMPLTREIPGRYRQIREYARGGMGRILIVHDSDTGREVALKELISKVSADGATVSPEQAVQGMDARHARFLREVRITGRLEHPSVVPIYELGQRTDGTLYYTMKLIRGRTFEQAIEEAGPLPGRLGLLPHFMDLCQAVAYAHSRGIVHRDIKPSNVLVGEFGETVLIDWGLATAVGEREAPIAPGEKQEEEGAAGTRLTRHGASLGTPRYMSPEQIRGDLARIAEPSDVFALGIMLYEILTGKHPYEGADTVALFHDVLTRDPVPVRSLEPKAPPELEAICRRAMNRKPEDRYAAAGELVNDLKRFQTGALVEAYRYNPMDRLRRFARRHAAILSTVAVALAAVIVTGAIAVFGIVREQAETELALYQASINLAYNAMDNGRIEEAEEALARAPAAHRGLEWGLVQGMCRPERMVLRGHKDIVEYAAYSPDGTKIITCGHDSVAFVWDARTGEKLQELHIPDNTYHRALWTPDGSLLILSTTSERICVYDAGDYRMLREMPGYAPVISPDGKYLAAATQYGEVVTFYDVFSGDVVRTFPKLPEHIIQLALSDNGKQLAAGIDDGSVWVWSLDAEGGRFMPRRRATWCSARTARSCCRPAPMAVASCGMQGQARNSAGSRGTKQASQGPVFFPEAGKYLPQARTEPFGSGIWRPARKWQNTMGSRAPSRSLRRVRTGRNSSRTSTRASTACRPSYGPLFPSSSARRWAPIRARSIPLRSVPTATCWRAAPGRGDTPTMTVSSCGTPRITPCGAR
jgi:serine/threonine protein kinase